MYDFAPTISAAGETRFSLPSGVQAVIDEQPFSQRNWKISACGAKSPACLIDGQLAYGASFETPKSYVRKITVTFSGATYQLDRSAMFDAWGNRPLQIRESIRYFGGSCTGKQDSRFRGLFSDGAGSFAAEWIIVAGHSTRTVLTDIRDVLMLFEREIDPPAVQDELNQILSYQIFGG